MAERVLDYSKFNPAYFEIKKIKSEMPHANGAVVANELNNRGFRKKNGSIYRSEDISHIWKIWNARAIQVENIKTRERLRKKDDNE
jgi:hypothetical protein